MLGIAQSTNRNELTSPSACQHWQIQVQRAEATLQMSCWATATELRAQQPTFKMPPTHTYTRQKITKRGRRYYHQHDNRSATAGGGKWTNAVQSLCYYRCCIWCKRLWSCWSSMGNLQEINRRKYWWSNLLYLRLASKEQNKLVHQAPNHHLALWKVNWKFSVFSIIWVVLKWRKEKVTTITTKLYYFYKTITKIGRFFKQLQNQKTDATNFCIIGQQPVMESIH